MYITPCYSMSALCNATMTGLVGPQKAPPGSKAHVPPSLARSRSRQQTQGSSELVIVSGDTPKSEALPGRSCEVSVEGA